MFRCYAIRVIAVLGAAWVGVGAPPIVPTERDREETRIEKLSLDEIVQRLPRRVTGKDGTLGDMVNFLITGSEDKMDKGLRAAGWVRVDRTKEEAILHAIKVTIEKGSYTEMPMSELFLFGRSQDFGYAKALPIEVVSSRHHFRLWKSQLQTLDGKAVWVGAGTHDIGIERDRRTRRISHKIDPEVDREREFIADSMNETGMVKELRYQRPADPVREAATATGARYRSDGRILVILLK